MSATGFTGGSLIKSMTRKAPMNTKIPLAICAIFLKNPIAKILTMKGASASFKLITHARYSERAPFWVDATRVNNTKMKPT